MIHPDQITGRLGNKMFQIAYLFAQMWDGEIPDIYLQNPKYFIEYDEEVKKMFSAGIPDKTDMVAIHVRRGKNPIMPSEPAYSENSFYVNLFSTDYYTEAMAQFPESDFLVFSDDIEWCKNQKIFEDCEFASGSELEDFNLMASCVGHIIANSSFSWWAAYVAPYTQLVIAPSANKWYSDGHIRTFCPDHWKRI